MLIHVSGKQFVFPRSCACCGSYPLTYLQVSAKEKHKGTRSRTFGWSWDIPYCVRCKKHIEAYERALFLTFTICLIALTSAMFVTFLVGIIFRASAAFPLLLGADWALYLFLVKRIASTRHVNCIGLTRAVVYLGSEGTRHSFDMKSRHCAAEFIRSNPHKLVNISAEVASILRGTQFGNYQIPRRIVKRS